jgi:protein SCO1/2
MLAAPLAVMCCALLAAASPAARAAVTATHAAPDFTLADQNGHPFTLARHRGHPVVLFFGYTHCPDVCPTILANLKRARELIGPPAADLVVALITVDRERDTPAALKQFVDVFDSSFAGLTGSAESLARVYRDYHVKAQKEAANTSGYLVSHSAFVYYIGRDGRLRGYGTWSDPTDVLQENLQRIVARPAAGAR